MHWHVHKDEAHSFAEYCRRRERIPVVGKPPMKGERATVLVVSDIVDLELPLSGGYGIRGR